MFVAMLNSKFASYMKQKSSGSDNRKIKRQKATLSLKCKLSGLCFLLAAPAKGQPLNRSQVVVAVGKAIQDADKSPKQGIK